MEDRPKSIIYKGARYTINKGYYKTTYALHRRVWEDHNGEMPIDHHIHHKNGDTLDNCIENLECLHKSKHHSMHFSAARQVEAMRNKESRLKRSYWAKSPAGQKSCSEASKKQWQTRIPITRKCIICLKEFLTKNYGRCKFCSQKCRTLGGYRASLIELECAICGSSYRAQKNRGKTCSSKCAGTLSSLTKLGVPIDPISTVK